VALGLGVNEALVSFLLSSVSTGFLDSVLSIVLTSFFSGILLWISATTFSSTFVSLTSFLICLGLGFFFS
jgi:hypothetical protein